MIVVKKKASKSPLPKDQKKWPKVSILMPVYNESRHIHSCLTRVMTNGYPKEKLEVLVVDGRSSDDTREIVRSLQESYPQIYLLDNPYKLPYPALNIGLRASTGEIIMRVDARAVIPEGYILQLYETSLRTGADNVGGLQRAIVDGSILKQAIAVATMSNFGTGGASFRRGGESGYVDTVYLGFFKRSIFDRVGVFDEDGAFISEDAMLNKRIIDSGGKVFLNVNLTVSYHGKDSLAGIARQYFIYGAAKCHSVLTYKKFTAWRQLIPLGAIGALYLHLLLIWFFKELIYSFLLGCLSYLFMNMAYSFRLAKKQRNLRLFLPLFVVFPAIHFNWANGFFVYLLPKKWFNRLFQH